MALIICPKCGKQFSDRAKACPQCGITMDEVQDLIKRKNKELDNEVFKRSMIALAIILIIFLFVFGIVKFIL